MNYRAHLRRAMPFLIDLRAMTGMLTRNASLPMLCPCCGRSSRFRGFGLPPRLNAVCANCGSRERHRLLRLYFDAHPELLTGDVLHFAPEAILQAYLEPRAGSYVGGDLSPRPGQQRLDIEAIARPADNFDLILCSHVLEHVDDRRALAELHRVLRPGGTLLLLFPLIEGWDHTFEDPAITTSLERLRYYGQEDHVRYFGRDARDRIRAAGFDLSEHTAVEPGVSTYGLLRGEKIFIARKPA